MAVAGTGGGGGAYSKSVNQALSSTTPTYQVGAGGASTANGMLARCCGRCCQAGHHRSDLHAIRRRDKIATALLSAASLFCSQIATRICAVTFSDTVTNSGVSLISATISYQ